MPVHRKGSDLMARGTYQEKRKQKIALILETAKRIFAEKGFSGARTDEIAKKAGISKMSMYYYVGNKKDLYSSVLQELLVYSEKYASQKVDLSSSPRENLTRIIKGIAEVADKESDLHAILLRELVSGGENIPKELPNTLGKTISLIDAVLKDGKKQHIFQDVDPFLFFFTAMGLFVYWKLHLPILNKIDSDSSLIENSGGQIPDKLVNKFEELIFKMISI